MDWENFYDESTKTWRGIEENLKYGLTRSIGEIIYENLKTNSQQIIQISDGDGKVFTKQEILTAAIRIALSLKDKGLSSGDFVGICARNSTFLLPFAIGCYFNTIPYHAMSPSHDQETIQHCFGITKPKIIICDGQDYAKIAGATKSFMPEIYTLTNHVSEAGEINELLTARKNEELYRPVELIEGCNQTMAVVCSSGTTGLPKAVCISNRSLVYERYMDPIESDDVVFSFSGLEWVTGMACAHCSVMRNSTRIITDKPFTTAYFVEIVKKYKITYVVTAPRYIALLNECSLAVPQNLNSVRVLMLGGTSVSNALLERACKHFPNAHVSIGYGCTEAGGAAINFGLKGSNSIGYLAPGYSARIIDPNGQCLGPNKHGEIVINNKRVWKGYYNNREETQSAQDTEGWIKTGDIGYFDSNNILYVIDRIKEIRKYCEIHYWPAEIENVITELPEVLQVSVVSIYDESKGDAAAAVIVRKAGAQLTEQQVCDHVAKRLPVDAKQLHSGVLFVNQLPTNPNGKVIKKHVQTLLVESKSKLKK